MKTAIEINEELEKLQKDSHPPIDWMEVLNTELGNPESKLVNNLKKLIVETIREVQYDSSPDRYED